MDVRFILANRWIAAIPARTRKSDARERQRWATMRGRAGDWLESISTSTSTSNHSSMERSRVVLATPSQRSGSLGLSRHRERVPTRRHRRSTIPGLPTIPMATKPFLVCLPLWIYSFFVLSLTWFWVNVVDRDLGNLDWLLFFRFFVWFDEVVDWFWENLTFFVINFENFGIQLSFSFFFFLFLAMINWSFICGLVEFWGILKIFKLEN